MLSYPLRPVILQGHSFDDKHRTDAHKAADTENHGVALLDVIYQQVLDKITDGKRIEQDAVYLRAVSNPKDAGCDGWKHT